VTPKPTPEPNETHEPTPPPKPLNTATSAPKISLVEDEWNIKIGNELVIPLSVRDDEADAFEIITQFTAKKQESTTTIGLPAGASISPIYVGANGLRTVDFKWMPNKLQATDYIVKFTAKETQTTKGLSSKAVSVLIHVWPGDTKEDTSVHKLILSTAKWNKISNEFLLTGVVEFSKSSTQADKTSFLNSRDIPVTLLKGITGNGEDISNIGDMQPIIFDAYGNWSLRILNFVLPTKSFPCSITLDIDGLERAAHHVSGAPAGCFKNAISIQRDDQQ